MTARTDTYSELLLLQTALENDLQVLRLWETSLTGALNKPSRAGSIKASRNAVVSRLRNEVQAARRRLMELQEEAASILEEQTSLSPPRD